MNSKKEKSLWERGFEILEESYVSYPVKDKFVSLLKKVSEIINTDDIQVFKYDQNKEKYVLFKALDDRKKILDNECNLFSKNRFEDNNMLFLTITTKYNSFIIVFNKVSAIDEEKKNILKRIFKLLIFKYETEKLLNNLYLIDSITGINNRTAYEEDTKKFFKDTPNKVTFAIMDLFRLKAINDNYGHKYGDLYISKAAHLLSDLITKTEKKGLYRIGGDEFVFFISGSKKKYFEKKILEVNKMLLNENLGLNLKFPLKINYGLVEGKGNLDSLYRRADKALSDDKRDTYLSLNIERRK